MGFYHPDITEESWKVLLDLNKRYSFILIGGWAVWLYTRALKSKDIDIVVDFEELALLRKEYPLAKNPRLKKYELKRGTTDVYIYVLHYSEFGIPPHLVASHVRSVEGFKVLAPEYLLVLKLTAAMNRELAAKGEKDRIDILSMLVSGSIDLRDFVSICGRNNLNGHLNFFERTVLRSQSEYASLGLTDLRKVRLFKERFSKELQAAKAYR